METPREPRETPSWARWTLLALVLGAVWLRLPGLTAEEPWFDEVFSIVLASQELPELLRRTVADQTNPPGFYLLLWAWTRLGGFDLAWMRLLPALAGTLTVPALALAARATGATWSGALVAGALVAVSPLALAMSSELRAYAPVALVTALAVVAAAGRRPFTLALCGILLVSMHYFGALVVAALALGALWADRSRPRDALLPAIPAAVALATWGLLVYASGGGGTVGGNAGWIPSVGLRALPSFGSLIIGTFGTVWGAVAVPLVLLLALALAGREAVSRSQGNSSDSARLVIAVAVLPLALVAAAIVLTDRALWVPRYLIIVLPGWILLVQRAVDRPGRWRATAIGALLVWATLAGTFAEQARVKKPAWSLIARALTAGAPRSICVNESYVGLPLRYQAVSMRLPLTVLDLADCTPMRAPDAIILREGTEASLDRLRSVGADVGRARDLGTALPVTTIVTLHWRAVRRAGARSGARP